MDERREVVLPVDDVPIGRLLLIRGGRRPKVQALGTSFAIAPDLAIACEHSIPRKAGRTRRPAREATEAVPAVKYEAVVFRYADDDVKASVVEALDDLVLLRLAPPIDSGPFPWFSLEDHRSLTRLAWESPGYPLSLDGDKLILGGSVRGSGQVALGGIPHLQLHCDETADDFDPDGHSGGPVVGTSQRSRRSLVGVIRRGLADETSGRAGFAGVMYAIPWAHIDDLLRKAGLPGLDTWANAAVYQLKLEVRAQLEAGVFELVQLRGRSPGLFPTDRDFRAALSSLTTAVLADGENYHSPTDANTRPIYRWDLITSATAHSAVVDDTTSRKALKL